MPDFCSCGAQLVEDARFCHKCGAPQRAEDIPPVVDIPPQPQDGETDTPTPSAEVSQADPPIPPLPASIAQLPINLSNPIVVRTAIFSASIAFLVSLLLGPLTVFVWAGGGFLAVFLYRKSTGVGLSLREGARLGWICGLFLFVIALIMLTVVISLQPLEELMTTMRDAMRQSYPDQPEIAQQVEQLFTPTGGITAVVVLFALMTLPTALGGAIGAKILDRE